MSLVKTYALANGAIGSKPDDCFCSILIHVVIDVVCSSPYEWANSVGAIGCPPPSRYRTNGCALSVCCVLIGFCPLSSDYSIQFSKNIYYLC